MAVNDWKVARSTKQCVCGKRLVGKPLFYSALRESAQSPEDFQRLDICEECWRTFDRKSLFCYWKARPIEENRKKRRVANDAVVLEFFWQLEDADTEKKRRFKFALALYLMRRKIFKLKEVKRNGDQEILVLSYPKGHKYRIELETPELTEESITKATDELNQLLEMEMENEDEC